MRIAFVSYETPFAPAGGIAAVMSKLPHAMRDLHGHDVAVFTPLHHRIAKTADLAPRLVVEAEVEVAYRSKPLPVQVLAGPDGTRFLKAADPRFFAGHPHPYLVEDAHALRRDALLFGAATWQAVQALAPGEEWVLLLQDWQAATTALAAAQAPHGKRPRMVLTLHNSYDAGVSDDDLGDFGLAPATCPGATALTRALPHVAAQVPTVSGQFALDLLGDPLQSRVLADHLQVPLTGRLVGVDNGPFAELRVPAEVLQAAERQDFAPLDAWKRRNRSLAVEALRSLEPSRERPFWGDAGQVLAQARGDLPWFVMAGRDDARQKGYDVAAEAVRTFLRQGGEACCFFFPIPGDEGLAGLSFLRELAEEFPGFVAGFPFRWTEGFLATLQGASFGLMPSFYEPFGMANEFYLHGTPGIGRATGGIVQQIVPMKGCASFSLAAEEASARWHAWSAPPTGLLYREAEPTKAVLEGWRHINDAAYARDKDTTQRLEQRKGLALFCGMVDELAMALEDGSAVSGDPALYGGMVVDGVRHVQRAFSWRRAAAGYGRIGRVERR